MGRSSHYRGGNTQRLRQRRHIASQYTHCANPACAVELDWNTPGLPHSGEVDHIEPVSLGGSLATGNLQGLCRRCNRAKSDRPPGEPITYGRRPAPAAAPKAPKLRGTPPHRPGEDGGYYDATGAYYNDTPAAACSFRTARRWTSR
jgi:5-methylcytosine-specific restriction endonuclease McrA